MKILTAEQIRAWDQYTIKHEPITSIDLMERAAGKCVEWLLDNNYAGKPIEIICGTGNNGGDGLAIARLLVERKQLVTVYVLGEKGTGSDDFKTNLQRLKTIQTKFIRTKKDFPSIPHDHVIIDALFGSGLNRPLDALAEELVDTIINPHPGKIISIDLPSGLFADRSSTGNIVVKATDTLTFQCYKPALLLRENSSFTGNVHLLDIGLKKEFLDGVNTLYTLIDETLATNRYKSRSKFAHKGNFGHALLVAGSYGKMGAALLAAKACLRSGAGLLTCHIPKCGYDILQATVPEAMVVTDFNSSFITKIEPVENYSVTGIGPGIGNASETKSALRELLQDNKRPMVLDADALNILGFEKDLMSFLVPGCILTPHPKEFERVFGTTENEFERLDLAKSKAKELGIYIVVKGHHTFIATLGDLHYFNSTGNAGMATAGSGDVLTGIITGLLAQGYSSEDSALLGVYLHGLAGDIAAEEKSMEAMIAGDIIDHLGDAFKVLHEH